MKSLYTKHPAETTTGTVRSTTSVATLPKKEATAPQFREHPKYDEKYCREYEATITGVFFFFIPLFFIGFGILSLVQYEGYNIYITIIGIGALVLRVVATLWVAKLSRELNRNSIQWIAFAFLLPGSALTVLGQKKKFFNPAEWKKHLYNHNRSITAPVPSKTQQAQSQPLQLAS